LSRYKTIQGTKILPEGGFSNANLMIVDQAAIFPVFFRMLRQLSRPNAVKSVADRRRRNRSGRDCSVGRNIQIAKAQRTPVGAEQSGNRKLTHDFWSCCASDASLFAEEPTQLSFHAFTELTIPCKSPHARVASS
jgi:hypothetical protein